MSSNVKPWVRDYLIRVATQHGHAYWKEEPKRRTVQIIDYLSFVTGTCHGPDEHIWAIVSDGSHKIHARFNHYALSTFANTTHGHKRLPEYGTAVATIEFKPAFGRVAKKEEGGMTHTEYLFLDVYNLLLVGAFGEATYGIPENIKKDKDIKIWMDGLAKGGGAGNILKIRMAESRDAERLIHSFEAPRVRLQDWQKQHKVKFQAFEDIETFKAYVLSPEQSLDFLAGDGDEPIKKRRKTALVNPLLSSPPSQDSQHKSPQIQSSFKATSSRQQPTPAPSSPNSASSVERFPTSWSLSPTPQPRHRSSSALREESAEGRQPISPIPSDHQHLPGVSEGGKNNYPPIPSSTISPRTLSVVPRALPPEPTSSQPNFPRSSQLGPYLSDPPLAQPTKWVKPVPNAPNTTYVEGVHLHPLHGKLVFLDDGPEPVSQESDAQPSNVLTPVFVNASQPDSSSQVPADSSSILGSQLKTVAQPQPEQTSQADPHAGQLASSSQPPWSEDDPRPPSPSDLPGIDPRLPSIPSPKTRRIPRRKVITRTRGNEVLAPDSDPPPGSSQDHGPFNTGIRSDESSVVPEVNPELIPHTISSLLLSSSAEGGKVESSQVMELPLATPNHQAEPVYVKPQRTFNRFENRKVLGSPKANTSANSLLTYFALTYNRPKIYQRSNMEKSRVHKKPLQHDEFGEVMQAGVWTVFINLNEHDDTAPANSAVVTAHSRLKSTSDIHTSAKDDHAGGDSETEPESESEDVFLAKFVQKLSAERIAELRQEVEESEEELDSDSNISKPVDEEENEEQEEEENGEDDASRPSRSTPAIISEEEAKVLGEDTESSEKSSSEDSAYQRDGSEETESDSEPDSPLGLHRVAQIEDLEQPDEPNASIIPQPGGPSQDLNAFDEVESQNYKLLDDDEGMAETGRQLEVNEVPIRLRQPARIHANIHVAQEPKPTLEATIKLQRPPNVPSAPRPSPRLSEETEVVPDSQASEAELVPQPLVPSSQVSDSLFGPYHPSTSQGSTGTTGSQGPVNEHSQTNDSLFGSYPERSNINPGIISVIQSQPLASSSRTTLEDLPNHPRAGQHDPAAWQAPSFMAKVGSPLTSPKRSNLQNNPLALIASHSKAKRKRVDAALTEDGSSRKRQRTKSPCANYSRPFTPQPPNANVTRSVAHSSPNAVLSINGSDKGSKAPTVSEEHTAPPIQLNVRDNVPTERTASYHALKAMMLRTGRFRELREQ